MAPVASTQSTDFDTAPFVPPLERDLTTAAGQTVILTVSVEGLGGIADYSVRIELPAFDDHLKAVAQIVYSVHAAAFAVNWPEANEPEED